MGEIQCANQKALPYRKAIKCLASTSVVPLCVRSGMLFREVKATATFMR
jgi:hypothetical protein